MKALPPLPCLMVLTTLIGCGSDGDDADYDYYYDEYLGDTVVTTTHGEDWTTSAVYPLTDPFEDPYFHDDQTLLAVSAEAATRDPEAIAVLIADNMPLYFTPSDCASVERAGSELTYTLSECRALFSASTIDGELRASFANDDGQITFAVTSEKLRIDGAEAALRVDGVYGAIGGTKTVRYTSRRTVERGQRSYAGEFGGVLAWSAGSNCVTRDATGRTTTAARPFNVSIDGYRRCAGECPTDGVITLSDDITTITLSFDGTAEARLERDNGQIETVELDCD